MKKLVGYELNLNVKPVEWDLSFTPVEDKWMRRYANISRGYRRRGKVWGVKEGVLLSGLRVKGRIGLN
jgi:hypothetical protein